MSTTVIEKNILIKNKILIKKYGKFRSIVIKTRQHNLFVKKIKLMIFIVEHSAEKRIKVIICHRMFEYIYMCSDLVYNFNCLKTILKKKIHELIVKDSSFVKYLELMGYECNFLKRNGIKCGKSCENFLCKTHILSKNRLITHIHTSLPIFDKNVCNNIIEYSLNKDWLV